MGQRRGRVAQPLMDRPEIASLICEHLSSTDLARVIQTSKTHPLALEASYHLPKTLRREVNQDLPLIPWGKWLKTKTPIYTSNSGNERSKNVYAYYDIPKGLVAVGLEQPFHFFLFYTHETTHTLLMDAAKTYEYDINRRALFSTDVRAIEVKRFWIYDRFELIASVYENELATWPKDILQNAPHLVQMVKEKQQATSYGTLRYNEVKKGLKLDFLIDINSKFVKRDAVSHPIQEKDHWIMLKGDIFTSDPHMFKFWGDVIITKKGTSHVIRKTLLHSFTPCPRRWGVDPQKYYVIVFTTFDQPLEMFIEKNTLWKIHWKEFD